MAVNCRLFPLVCALIIFVSCARPPEAQEGQNDDLTRGNTASMRGNRKQPLYNLEYIGSIVEPASKGPVHLRLNAEFSVKGWAVDPEAQKAAGGVEILIDGIPYRATYALPRKDVADHFGIPEYASAGFALTTKTGGAIGRGMHRVAVRILTNDRASYYEGLPVAVGIE
jgi:hypothetical protein